MTSSHKLDIIIIPVINIEYDSDKRTRRTDDQDWRTLKAAFELFLNLILNVLNFTTMVTEYAHCYFSEKF